MTEVFIIVWSGGYDPPQYEVRPNRTEAFALAKSWAEDMEEGVDTVDVLRLDLDSMTIEREK